MTSKNKKTIKPKKSLNIKKTRASDRLDKKKKHPKPGLKLNKAVKVQKTKKVSLKQSKESEIENAGMLKKIYEEREKLEMERLTTVLSGAQARQFLVDLAGENTLNILRNFYGSLSDDELAKRLKIKISDVRATLNKLHNKGLVNYVREKDNETGWFTYSWSLNKEKIENWVSEKKKEGSDIDIEKDDYYFCPSCGTESVVNFANASNSSFRCGKCEKNLEFIDTLGKLEDLPLRRR